MADRRKQILNLMRDRAIRKRPFAHSEEPPALVKRFKTEAGVVLQYVRQASSSSDQPDEATLQGLGFAAENVEANADDDFNRVIPQEVMVSVHSEDENSLAFDELGMDEALPAEEHLDAPDFNINEKPAGKVRDDSSSNDEQNVAAASIFQMREEPVPAEVPVEPGIQVINTGSAQQPLQPIEVTSFPRAQELEREVVKLFPTPTPSESHRSVFVISPLRESPVPHRQVMVATGFSNRFNREQSKERPHSLDRSRSFRGRGSRGVLNSSRSHERERERAKGRIRESGQGRTRSPVQTRSVAANKPQNPSHKSFVGSESSIPRRRGRPPKRQADNQSRSPTPSSRGVRRGRGRGRSISGRNTKNNRHRRNHRAGGSSSSSESSSSSSNPRRVPEMNVDEAQSSSSSRLSLNAFAQLMRNNVAQDIDPNQLREIRTLFTYHGPRNVPMTQLVINRKLRRSPTLEQQLYVVYLRYGVFVDFNRKNQPSYAEIGRKTGLGTTTVYGILKRYHENGNKVILKRKFNSAGRIVITPEIQSYLLSQETIQQMVGWSLYKRVIQIQRTHGIRISVSALHQFYKKNGVRYAHVNYQHYHVPDNAWHESRHQFVYRLGQLVGEGRNFVYMDETSIHSWTHRSKTFRFVHDATRVWMPRVRHGQTTIYGAIGNCLVNNFAYQFATSTNRNDFIRFLGFLRQSVRPQIPRMETIIVIMDNHSAHRSAAVHKCMYDLHLEPMYLPTYSPELNAIEMVWGQVKKRMQDYLAEAAHLGSLTRDAFLAMVTRSLQFPAEAIERLIQSNRREVLKLLTSLEANFQNRRAQ